MTGVFAFHPLIIDCMNCFSLTDPSVFLRTRSFCVRNEDVFGCLMLIDLCGIILNKNRSSLIVKCKRIEEHRWNFLLDSSVFICTSMKKYEYFDRVQSQVILRNLIICQFLGQSDYSESRTILSGWTIENPEHWFSKLKITFARFLMKFALEIVRCSVLKILTNIT